jgi:hypothetical protein
MLVMLEARSILTVLIIPVRSLNVLDSFQEARNDQADQFRLVERNQHLQNVSNS